MAGQWRGALANVVAASPIWPRSWRRRWLRALGVTIGARSRVLPYTHFIGDTSGLTIGKDCFLNIELLVGSGAPVTIGDNVLIGPRVQLVPAVHEIGPSSRRGGPRTSLPITIGAGCWLGAGVSVLGGVTIGPGCVVAAGAVVTGDLAADGLYGGVPAKLIRTLDPDTGARGAV